MHRIPKSWIAVVAIIAAIGVLFVLITPAPDELPSTGPHSLDKAFLSIVAHFLPLAPEVFSGTPLHFTFILPFSRDNLIALTCVRLC
ncbi:MAG TPA: hypothetical protein VLW84_14670 [Terriglobales bacterium]|nr:hypothetical protein [Terriglobales bacterium]HUK48668.1 hypothetical protein [Terriglobales bacterium]